MRKCENRKHFSETGLSKQKQTFSQLTQQFELNIISWPCLLQIELGIVCLKKEILCKTYFDLDFVLNEWYTIFDRMQETFEFTYSIVEGYYYFVPTVCLSVSMKTKIFETITAKANKFVSMCVTVACI